MLGCRSVHQRFVQLFQRVNPKLVPGLHLKLANEIVLLLLVEGGDGAVAKMPCGAGHRAGSRRHLVQLLTLLVFKLSEAVLLRLVEKVTEDGL